MNVLEVAMETVSQRDDFKPVGTLGELSKPFSKAGFEPNRNGNGLYLRLAKDNGQSFPLSLSKAIQDDIKAGKITSAAELLTYPVFETEYRRTDAQGNVVVDPTRKGYIVTREIGALAGGEDLNAARAKAEKLAPKATERKMMSFDEMRAALAKF